MGIVLRDIYWIHAQGIQRKNSEVLLKRWLDIPNGICVSKERQWIAVSNHNTQTVLLYKNGPSLNASSIPDGILRQIDYPHGLRFTSDGRFIFVADAGSPYVNIYKKDRSEWRGVRDPVLSFKVLNDDEFLRGRHSREEGGPKGIDINNNMDILVTTCEVRPLAFFDVVSVLERVSPEAEELSGSNYSLPGRLLRGQKALEVRYELYRRRIVTILRRIVRKLRTR